ncbi:MAG: hypothetical protein MJ065_02070 [Oscillospiraceae bacterium]|nr:hypothetical protein [Oscillospiraceae bacterium]
MDKQTFLSQYVNYSDADLRLIRDTQKEMYSGEEMAWIEELIEARSAHSSEKAKSDTWLCVVSLIIPLFGIIAGIIFRSTDKPEDQKTGRRCLNAGICGLILWVMFVFTGPLRF